MQAFAYLFLKYANIRTPVRAPLFVHRNLWRYNESGGKSKCSIIGNFSVLNLWALIKGGSIGVVDPISKIFDNHRKNTRFYMAYISLFMKSHIFFKTNYFKFYLFPRRNFIYLLINKSVSQVARVDHYFNYIGWELELCNTKFRF